MAKEKFAHSGSYIIYQDENGKIFVWKDFDNTKEALREAANLKGIEYDPGWTTRQFGHKLIQMLRPGLDYASCGEYFIREKADGSIFVSKWYDNVKGALREISESIGFEFDNDWTTRQFGSKLIDKLNS